MSSKPSPPKKQCACRICRFDRDPNLFGGADIFEHFETQAHSQNQFDTLASRNQYTLDCINRAFHKLANSEEDFQQLLENYEYFSFEFRIVGHKHVKDCSCDSQTLLASGCSCGGQ